MADRSLDDLIRRLRRMLGPKDGTLPDSELLGRFVERGDEEAFESLVWRHGSMVLGVCRRLTRREQDAEDAFQATFLVLARKAKSLRKKGSVGPWLCRVSRRVALRTRRQNSGDERSLWFLADSLPAPAAPAEIERLEMQRLLEDEIYRLPSRYREAAVLRYLEGRSTAEAARALGCPAGTVLSRLSWARERLRTRLAARGLAVTAALAIKPRTTHAVPVAAVKSTSRAAVQFRSAKTISLPRTTPILLAEGVLQAMLTAKWTIGRGASGGGLYSRNGFAGIGHSQKRATRAGRKEPDQCAGSRGSSKGSVRNPAHQAEIRGLSRIYGTD